MLDRKPVAGTNAAKASNGVPRTPRKPPHTPYRAAPHQVHRIKNLLAAEFPDAALPGECAGDTAIRLLGEMKSSLLHSTTLNAEAVRSDSAQEIPTPISDPLDASPAAYADKADIVSAVRFLPDRTTIADLGEWLPSPHVLVRHGAGRWDIIESDGDVFVKCSAGDWLIKTSDHDWYVLTDDEFKARFARLVRGHPGMDKTDC
jgi:hypothetical protein